MASGFSQVRSSQRRNRKKRSNSSILLALPARQLAVKQAPCEARDVAPRRGGRAGHSERRESARGSVSNAADENVVDVDRNSAPSKEIDERKGKLQLQLELRQRPQSTRSKSTMRSLSHARSLCVPRAASLEREKKRERKRKKWSSSTSVVLADLLSSFGFLFVASLFLS